MSCCLKVLAPEALAAAIIGRGGGVIAALRQSTQAKITLTEHSELYPGTDCRVLTAQAATEEALTEVITRIIVKIGECVQTSPSEALGSPGELKLKTLAPRAAVGGLIGKGGATIKQLRESSNAKISVSEATGTGPSAEQTVTVVGTPEALEQVMAEVNRQVQALSKEGWFQTWMSMPGTVSGTGSLRNGPTYAGNMAAAAPPTMLGALPGGAYGSMGGSPGLDLMVRVAQGLPPYVTQDSRGFALSCVVPNRLVGGLIGRGGAGTKEVQNVTGTKIGIREIPGDAENRSMNITGPLTSTCAAYMMMMKRYLDAEAQAAGTTDVGGGGGGGGGGNGGGGGRRRPGSGREPPQQPPPAT